jgi:hypothetical protein
VKEFTIRLPDREDGRRLFNRAKERLDAVDPEELKASAATAAAGLKGRLAESDTPSIKLVDAHKLVKATRACLEAAYEVLEAQHDATSEALASLGQAELAAYDGPLRQFANAFAQLKNVTIADIETDSLPPAIAEYDTSVDAIDFRGVDAMKTLAAGGGAGALSGFVTMAAVGTFASASTGTAIAGLSGAAATNATLAWLGGGSLAAGGGGMAAGAIVLGGLVAAPVLAVGGLVVHQKGRAALAKAQSDAVEADVSVGNMELAQTVARGIELRAVRTADLLEPLAVLLGQRAAVLAHLVGSKQDYATYGERDRNVVMVATTIAKTVRAVIDVPLLTEDGQATRESRRVLDAAEVVLRQEGVDV